MLRRLSVDASCKGAYTCPSVWQDDVNPDELVIVGHPAELGVVPMAEGEIAIRVRRQVIADAEIG
jgi:hypothetical protein